MRTIITAALTATALLAVAAPAHAGSETVEDPRGDTTATSGSRAVDTPAYTPAYTPASSADIVRTTGRYADDTMTITLRVRGLDRRRPLAGKATFVTSDADVYYASTSRVDGVRRVRVYTPEGEDVDCNDKDGTFDFPRDRIVLSVPSRCLGRPDWIRWGASTYAGGRPHGEADDARKRGHAGPAERVGERRLRQD